MKEVPLPSGAVLKISHTPFSVSRALYQAVLEEFKSIPITGGTDINEALKNVLCVGFSSKNIESKLAECLKFALYNHGKGDQKIEDSTFDTELARKDYPLVCLEVGLENVIPFMKGLYAGLKRVSTLVLSSPL